jgi:pimeloyl-ACP methyl ester carboxylesterase
VRPLPLRVGPGQLPDHLQMSEFPKVAGAPLPLARAFESILGRYPEPVREIYLASDATAMRAAWSAATDEGAISDDLGAWRIPSLIVVAAEDVDFYEQARRAADEIPGAGFLSLKELDHLGVDTAEVDPVLPAVLRTLRS